MFKQVLILSLLVWQPPLYARMYQWVDPDTGTTQLSGKPPAWYRDGGKGPRIFVFENGKVIDDTGINVNDDLRDTLRQQAFISAEKDKEAARQEQLEASRLKMILDRNQKSQAQLQEPANDESLEKDQVSGQDEVQPEEENTVEKMQALIRQWEELQTENARNLVESNAPGSSAPAPGKNSPAEK